MADKSIVSNSKLTAIANAIRSKTGSTENLTLDNMVTKIQSMSGAGSGGGLKTLLDATKSCYYLFYQYTGTSVDDLINYSDTENVTSMNCMFYHCDNLQTIPELNTSKVTSMDNMFNYCISLETIPQLDTGKVTNMFKMFTQCTNLTTIPLLDTSEVTNMSYMFSNCSKLTPIPLLDTSKVTNMDNMFSNCSNLTTIPLLDTSKVTNMSYMFRGCSNLQTIDIISMDKITSAVKSYSMCDNCNSLTKLIIRTMTTTPTLYSNAFTNCYHFTGTVNSTYNPDGLKDGRIYVPDNMVDSLKAATNWSVYADIIVPLSTLTE